MSSDESAEPKRERSVLLTVCPFILGTELCERLAYYGTRSNLINCLKRYGASNATAAILVSSIGGFSGVGALVGGWIADARLGRYRTILYSVVVYLLALSILTLGAAIPGIRVESGQSASVLQWLILGMGILFVTVGAGGIKPNVSPFGADQFDDTRERDQREKKSFFNWFYFFINVGGALASTVVVYIQDQGMWAVSFAVTGVAMVCSLILFVTGRGFYKRQPPTESVLVRFLRVIRKAIQNRPRKGNYQPIPSEEGQPPTEEKSHWLDWATESGPTRLHTQTGHICEAADCVTFQEVTDAKLVFRVLPILFTTIMFWSLPIQLFCVLSCGGDRVTASQTDDLRLVQGSQMDRRIRIFGHDTLFPAASLIFFNAGTLLIAIPLYDRLLLPFLSRWFSYSPTLLQRIGVGYLLALGSAFSSFCIEKGRMHLYEQGQYFLMEVDGDEVEVVEMSVFWLIIPESLNGLAEVGASIGLLEFFYSQAPDSMYSIMAALNLVTSALSGYFWSLLLFILDRITTSVGSPWITDNLNEGNLSAVYLLVAGMMLANCCYYLYVARQYRYRESKTSETRTLEITSFRQNQVPTEA